MIVRRALPVLVALACLALPAASPASARAGDLILEARTALARGDAIAAEARLEEALDQGASRRAIAAAMGRALLAQDKARAARRWLEGAGFSSATAVEGYRALAQLEIRSGNLPAAGRAYDVALALAPDDPELWVDVARLRYLGGEHLLAIEASDRAMKLGPENVRALELKGQLVRDRGGLAQSLAWFAKAHRLAPEDLSVLGEYAATTGELGQAKRMLTLTRRMLALDPDNPRAFYLQAVMAARAGNYPLARALFNRTSGTLKGVPSAMLLEGALELGVGNYTLAVEALEPLVRKQPANSKARNLLVRALFLAGEHKYLIERFAPMARRPGASAYLQILVARSYEQLGHRREAAVLLDAAAQARSAPVRPVANGNRIGQLLAAGKIGEADALAASWLVDNPGYYDHLAAAGDVQLARGNARAAMQYYARAAQIRMPESLMTRRFQAMLMAGETAMATVLLKRYLANHPASDEALRLAGGLSALSSDWERAGMFLEAARAHGGERDVQLLADLAFTQLRAGDLQAAEASAREAYRLQRSSPVAAQVLGLSLAAKGSDTANARALLDKARAMMGDNPLLAEARMRLREAG